jgi:hypothetical protein
LQVLAATSLLDLENSSDYKTGISFLDSQAVGIVHPVASFRVNLARVPISVVASGLRRAGLLLTPSLNPGIAFALSDFSDIAPSFTSFGPIFLLLLAEGHLTRRRFGAMTGRIALLPVPTG